MSRRVLIAGGGIGGLAAANALLSHGIDCTVFERATELREIGAAIGVQTNAMKSLRSMGREEAVAAIGVPIENYEYWSWHGRRLVNWPQGEIGRRLGAETVVVHRADLQQALLGGLSDGVIDLDRTVAGFEEDAEGVTLNFTDGTSERGDLLVGADGIHSVIRTQMLGETGLRYAGWQALRGIATFSDPSLPIGIARQYLGRGRTFGMWHLPGDRVYWVGTIRVPEGSEDKPGGRKKEILEWFGSGPSIMRRLIEATDGDVILRNDIHDRKPVESWSTKRVTLLGDAAHATTPVTGQGGGQAIEDAAVLANRLVLTDLDDTDAVAAALKAYEEVRIPRTADIITEAWTISAMHHWTNPFVCSLRDWSLKLQPKKVWIKRMENRLDSYQEAEVV